MGGDRRAEPETCASASLMLEQSNPSSLMNRKVDHCLGDIYLALPPSFGSWWAATSEMTPEEEGRCRVEMRLTHRQAVLPSGQVGRLSPGSPVSLGRHQQPR